MSKFKRFLVRTATRSKPLPPMPAPAVNSTACGPRAPRRSLLWTLPEPAAKQPINEQYRFVTEWQLS